MDGLRRIDSLARTAVNRSRRQVVRQDGAVARPDWLHIGYWPEAEGRWAEALFGIIGFYEGKHEADPRTELHEGASVTG